MDNTNILDELNQEQCSVCKSDKNILLTACPGSGKTKTIIHRLAYIQDKFQDSQMYNIAITYTNRAADEIFTRIENMGIDTSSIWTGTIHQFCMNFIIRPYAMYSSRLNKGYHIIDEYTQKKYCYEIADALGIRLKYNEKPFIHENLKFEYEKRLLKNREIDFDMILELSLDLLKNNVFIAENISRVTRSINVKLQDYNELYQVYELFLDKTKERIKNYKLSTDFEDICSFFVEKHGVVINTIHGVKGEEYTTVIGFCLLNGIIPHWDYIYKEELKPLRHNETNKLLYVLMSRAKKNLYLFSETGRKTSNGNLLSQTDELRCLS